MEKILIEAKVRLGYINGIYADGTIDFWVFYYNQMYCMMEEGHVESILTDDELEIYYDEEDLRVIYKNTVNESSLMFSKDCLDLLHETMEFVSEVPKIGDFEIPSDILLICMNVPEICIDIELVGKVTGVAKQKIMKIYNEQ